MKVVNIVVNILSQTINTQFNDRIPYGAWFNTKPSVLHYRVFGSRSYVFVNPQVQTKLDPKKHSYLFCKLQLYLQSLPVLESRHLCF